MKNNIFTKVCFITLAAFISTGCAARYGCKAPEGKSCSSITDVYTDSLQGEKKPEVKPEVKKGLVENTLEQTEPIQETDNQESDKKETDKKTELIEPVVLPSPTAITDKPTISAPKVLRIWVAPWEDDDGDLHEPGHVYMQVDKGKWVY